MCVLGRCEVGAHHWAQCNDVPVKYARFPVTGLVEGRSYIFRVRALNRAGVSRPSRVSEPVVAMDPSDRARLRGESDITSRWHTATKLATALSLRCLFYSSQQLAFQPLGLGWSNSQRRTPMVWKPQTAMAFLSKTCLNAGTTNDFHLLSINISTSTCLLAFPRLSL